MNGPFRISDPLRVTYLGEARHAAEHNDPSCEAPLRLGVQEERRCRRSSNSGLALLF